MGVPAALVAEFSLAFLMGVTTATFLASALSPLSLFLFKLLLRTGVGGAPLGCLLADLAMVLILVAALMEVLLPLALPLLLFLAVP
jgi:hypothetical protein